MSLLKAKENEFICFLRNLNVESRLLWKKGLETAKRGVFQRNKTSKPLDKIERSKKIDLAFVRDFSLSVLWYGRTMRKKLSGPQCGSQGLKDSSQAPKTSA